MAHLNGTAQKAVSREEAASHAPKSKDYGPDYVSRKSVREDASANPLYRGFEPGSEAGAKTNGWDGASWLKQRLGITVLRRCRGNRKRGLHLATIS